MCGIQNGNTFCLGYNRNRKNSGEEGNSFLFICHQRYFLIKAFSCICFPQFFFEKFLALQSLKTVAHVSQQTSWMVASLSSLSSSHFSLSFFSLPFIENLIHLIMQIWSVLPFLFIGYVNFLSLYSLPIVIVSFFNPSSSTRFKPSYRYLNVSLNLKLKFYF